MRGDSAYPATAQSAGAPVFLPCSVAACLSACLPAWLFLARRSLASRLGCFEGRSVLLFRLCGVPYFFNSSFYIQDPLSIKAATSVLGREIQDLRCWMEGSLYELEGYEQL